MTEQPNEEVPSQEPTPAEGALAKPVPATGNETSELEDALSTDEEESEEDSKE
jgi:hypothetical protein